MFLLIPSHIHRLFRFEFGLCEDCTGNLDLEVKLAKNVPVTSFRKF